MPLRGNLPVGHILLREHMMSCGRSAGCCIFLLFPSLVHMVATGSNQFPRTVITSFFCETEALPSPFGFVKVRFDERNLSRGFGAVGA